MKPTPYKWYESFSFFFSFGIWHRGDDTRIFCSFCLFCLFPLSYRSISLFLIVNLSTCLRRHYLNGPDLGTERQRTCLQSIYSKTSQLKYNTRGTQAEENHVIFRRGISCAGHPCCWFQSSTAAPPSKKSRTKTLQTFLNGSVQFTDSNGLFKC